MEKIIKLGNEYRWLIYYLLFIVVSLILIGMVK